MGLNVKCKTKKLLEKKISEKNLWDPRLSKEFLDLPPEA